MHKISFKNISILFILATPLLSGCVAAVATTALVGTDMATDRRTSGSYIEDQTIELKSGQAISDHNELDQSSNINVTSFNRVVLLVGQAPNESLRNTASEIVRKIDNVRKVHNEIRISAPNSLLSSTSDTWITTKAKSLMLAEQNFASGHIKIITENGELFLMGLVTRAEADKAIAIVRNIDGVERVVQAFEYMP
ncbi:MAG: osmotically-inducible protein OsmY [Enterobacterales bacterium]|jgi:osmotically-inducible protein OsmY